MNIYRRSHSLQTSGEIAKARAKMTVEGDRLCCNPEELLLMQRELVNILSKYMNLNENILEIKMNLIYETSRGIQDVKTIQIK